MDNIKNMLESIKEYLCKNNFIYIDIPEESIENIYNLLINNIKKEVSNDIECLYYGIYYKIKKDYDLMKKYYLMSINNNNSYAMNNLGFYYQNIVKDYNKMKKYYLMSIENGNSYAMNNLGDYYQYKEINYDLMKKYYLMSIENGNSNAMNHLGGYYQYKEKNYDEMKKYYLMAIDKGYYNAMHYLIEYFISKVIFIDENLPSFIIKKIIKRYRDFTREKSTIGLGYPPNRDYNKGLYKWKKILKQRYKNKYLILSKYLLLNNVNGHEFIKYNIVEYLI